MKRGKDKKQRVRSRQTAAQYRKKHALRSITQFTTTSNNGGAAAAGGGGAKPAVEPVRPVVDRPPRRRAAAAAAAASAAAAAVVDNNDVPAVDSGDEGGGGGGAWEAIGADDGGGGGGGGGVESRHDNGAVNRERGRHPIARAADDDVSADLRQNSVMHTFLAALVEQLKNELLPTGSPGWLTRMLKDDCPYGRYVFVLAGVANC